jgi:hypothetical protein
VIHGLGFLVTKQTDFMRLKPSAEALIRRPDSPSASEPQEEFDAQWSPTSPENVGSWEGCDALMHEEVSRPPTISSIGRPLPTDNVTSSCWGSSRTCSNLFHRWRYSTRAVIDRPPVMSWTHCRLGEACATVCVISSSCAS